MPIYKIILKLDACLARASRTSNDFNASLIILIISPYKRPAHTHALTHTHTHTDISDKF